MMKPTKSQTLTFDVEHSLVGALLVCQLNSTARDVLTWLKPEMFATAQLGAIYGAIQRQALNDNLIDLVLLNTDYGQDLAMLADIARKTTSSANLRGYAEKVRWFYQRREMQKIFLSVANELNQARDEKLDEITAKGVEDLSRLLNRGEKVKPLAMPMLLERFMGLMEERANPDYQKQLLRTGVGALDEKLGGIGDTDICIVAGRAGNGKTETAITFTKNIIENKGSVLFFSLEMNNGQIMDRLMASRSGVNSVKLRNPQKMDDTDFARMGVAMKAMKDQSLFLVDKSDLSADEIIAISENHIQEQGKPTAIMIDYVGLVRHGALDGRINRTYQIGETLRKFKAFCKDHHVPMILLAQLNRSAENGRPTNADLRESGSLEQDASQIIMVHNKRDKATNEPNQYTEWIVTKNRFGTVGTVYVEFQQGRFVECDQALANQALTENSTQTTRPPKGAYTKDYARGIN